MAGGGIRGSFSILGPHCGEQLDGLSIMVGFDIVAPGVSSGVAVGKNNGIGMSGGLGPGVGAGLSAGIDVCYMKVFAATCQRTPPECKGCK